MSVVLDAASQQLINTTTAAAAAAAGSDYSTNSHWCECSTQTYLVGKRLHLYYRSRGEEEGLIF